ncbi:unnamed protein product [Didymodactylos carnosus]|uniref:Uncharacterized protein n=1 Tax=Didymodactylos carnosus TaxID=1234261 RepID=A0A813T2D7_9BILA|nr:unnamed protein product [Didymodactylos carnosus]CAF0804329.1 unnamed protein product [Didymodactylos carnosus]CAF3556786.1 unnamed protein product [Didymodactylos carnosus]CAF3589555.1 unnamed protein product [Didymodactylos carnosus]
MYAPRAKFERIYVVPPLKVSSIFLAILHCFFLIIALFTSFWVETKHGHFGPLFRCEKSLDLSLLPIPKIIYQCHLFDKSIAPKRYSKWMLVTAILLLISFFIIILSIIIGTLSIIRNSQRSRRPLWLCTIILIFIGCLVDALILIIVPLAYNEYAFRLQWAYGLFCGATLFILTALIVAILPYNVDEIQYIETIEETRGELEPFA